jgi:hypothetical protein
VLVRPLDPVQILERNNLKGGKVYFVSSFQRLQFMVCWLHISGPEMRQNIMMEGYG